MINFTCPICKGKNTYYLGKGIFYCKDCKKNVEKKLVNDSDIGLNKNEI